MKKISIKIKALECSQHYMSIFQKLKCRLLHSRWLDLVELNSVQALMHVLVSLQRSEDDPINNEGTKVVTSFLHCKPIGIFLDAQGHLTQQSIVGSS